MQAEAFDWWEAGDIIGIAETHLAGDKFEAAKGRLRGVGFDVFGGPAQRTGRSAAGTHGGTMVLAKRHLAACPVEDEALVRVRACTILFVELYLVTGEDLFSDSMRVLKAAASLVKLHGLPVVVAADWQNSAEVLEASGWARSLGLTVARPVGGHTCKGAEGRAGSSIDYFAVSDSLVEHVRA